MGKKTVNEKAIKRIDTRPPEYYWDWFSKFEKHISKDTWECVIELAKNLYLYDTDEFDNRSCISADEGQKAVLNYLGITSHKEQQDICYWAANAIAGFDVGELKYYSGFISFPGLLVGDLPDAIVKHNRMVERYKNQKPIRYA
jgi:hypothetical protein